METPPFTLGVEEEYQIVDPKTRKLRPRAKRIVPMAQHEAGEGVQNEFFLSQIETGTPVCSTLAEVRGHVKRLRKAIIEAAEADGHAIAAAGTHPMSRGHDQAVTPKDRYLDMRELYQFIAREHLICGCHVHVGINDREAAIQILNRARGWMAPLLAISGNSPYWGSQDTGYASFRTEIWRRWPMAGSPQSFASRAEYDAVIRALVATESISDETKIYWDIRPADRFETLEFRVADVGLTLDDAVLLSGLVQGLAITCYRNYMDDLASETIFRPVRPELLHGSEWRAARYGLSEKLIDVHTERLLPAWELIDSLLAFVRPALEERGDWEEIDALIERLRRDGNGADRQRAVYEKRERFTDVVDYIVHETARGVKT